jgi:anchored repeat ABC transporter substrate-binding protein
MTMVHLLILSAIVLSACTMGSRETPRASDAINVAVTTEIIADLVGQVGTDRVHAFSIVPPGGDPHSYEPTTADARKLAQARVAFTNHLLLEEHALIKLFDSNVPQGSPNIALAESAERYGAHLIPFVEDVRLDVVWLGLAVRGSAESRSAEVHLRAVALEGPGDLFVYVTDVFGRPRMYFDSRNGFDASDVAVLPSGAHTHVNWAFTTSGAYVLSLTATLVDRGRETDLGRADFTFAVGVPPASIAGSRAVLSEGHADVAIDLRERQLFVCTAPLSCSENVGDVSPAQIVIEVPNRAVGLVPQEPEFAFLGNPGTRYWELPQAVLGKHVHGIIDPHTWQDVKNARAYVQVIADTLIAVDPDGREHYERNRDAYLAQLDQLDAYVKERLSRIPRENRRLITTHDAFSYLAKAYGMEIAGFVVPNPAQEPSAVQVTRLVETIRNLKVPAVFAESNLHARASVLRQVAQDHGVQVCLLYGDAFGGPVRSYVDMMRHNADELNRCLGGSR